MPRKTRSQTFMERIEAMLLEGMKETEARSRRRPRRSKKPADPAAQREQLVMDLEHAGLPAELAAFAQPSVRIHPERVDSERLPLGASRFGGTPDVPRDFRWPSHEGRDLVFLAQLDLAACHVGGLPTDGWLLFFYDVNGQPWGHSPEHRGGAVVIHASGSPTSLVRTAPPRGRDDWDFSCCSLSFEPSLDLPDPLDSVLERAGVRIAPEDEDAYRDLIDGNWATSAGVPYHHLLGHPQLIQEDMRGACELVTHGIDCGEPNAYRSAKAKKLLGGAQAWQLLLQIDSDERGPGWMWGDTGRLYFWIRRHDLAEQRFESAWCVLQCG